jgi:hypothetical protein
LGSVSLSPHPYELNEAGGTVDYLAAPIAANDACIVLQCDAYNWDWKHGDGNADGRAVFATPLKPGSAPNTISCRQTGVAVSETGDVPVHMQAIALPDAVKGVADLYVKFVPPKVMEHFPACDEACINALIWAKFNVAIDPGTVAGNVEIRPCANENCVISELGAPLAISADHITVTPVPKSTETGKRFLRIEAVTSGALPGTKNPLLVPGKYYRVLLRGGGDTGIKGMNGVAMSGLNDPDGFVWTFRTKLGEEALCKVASVDLAPLEKYEQHVGARQLFVATPFTKPDVCSSQGQTLIQTQAISWATSDKKVADYVEGNLIDTGGPLPAQCSPICLAMGSQGQFGKVAVCGNGLIETTDASYCVNKKNLLWRCVYCFGGRC